MRLPVLLILFCVMISSCAQKKEIMKEEICDPITGVCLPQTLKGDSTIESSKNAGLEIIYVGDPMCSWCYGISKELLQLRDYQQANGGKFSIVAGGLRPGGGEEWNEEFKDFLKHHWDEIEERTGQPFGKKLFDLDSFTYDTEPSCRAIVAARPLVGEKELEFFEAVQTHFYLDNEDPKQVTFYKEICETFAIDFKAFKTRFEDPEIKKETYAEFVLNRKWGVSGYPSVLIASGDQKIKISSGYMTFKQLKKKVEEGKLQLENR